MPKSVSKKELQDCFVCLCNRCMHTLAYKKKYCGACFSCDGLTPTKTCVNFDEGKQE